MTTEELLKKSVTRDDQGSVKHGVLQYIVPFFQTNQNLPLPPELPGYWSFQQDIILRNTIYKETMWAAAVSIAITKVASLSWEISGNVPPVVVRRYQKLFLDADGKQIGWVGFLSKHLRDFLTTDNGAFVEIVREKKSRGSKVVGLRHLDSLRCSRSGDPDIPVLYRDRKGEIHEMRDYQVMMFSDLPDPSETYYGVGISAAHRAYPAIRKLAVMEQYLQEKITGMRPLAIYIVNGLLDTQLKQAVNVAKTDEQSRGMMGYMGAVLIGVPDDVQPQVATIPLAELPDRFNRGEEFDIALYSYADNLGLDVQDLKPLGGIAMGSGSQSMILHDKARGKGLVAWKSAFTHAINDFVLPPRMAFKFIEKDYRDMQQASAVSSTKAQTAAARIAAGITTAPQELQVLVDEGDLPKEFLEKDITGNQIASDDEKLTEGLPEPPKPKVWGLDENGRPLRPTGTEPDMIPFPEMRQPKIWGLDENGQPFPQSLPQEAPIDEQVENIIAPKIWGLDDEGRPLPKLRRSEEAEEEILPELQAPRPKIWGLGKEPIETTEEPRPPQKIWGLDENGVPLHEEDDLDRAMAEIESIQPKIWGLDEYGEPLRREPVKPKQKIWGLKEQDDIQVSADMRASMTDEAIEVAKELFRQVRNGSKSD